MYKVKHKTAKKRHNFERGTLKELTEGWRLITAGMKKIDSAILREMLQQRKGDNKRNRFYVK